MSEHPNGEPHWTDKLPFGKFVRAKADALKLPPAFLLGAIGVMGLAIGVTGFCCLPVGLIVLATSGDSKPARERVKDEPREENRKGSDKQPAPKITLPVADFSGVNYKTGRTGEPLTAITQANANFDFPTGQCTTVDVSRSGYRTKDGEFIPHGREVGYYPDDDDPQKTGKLKLEIYWFAGKPHGPCTQWYKNGQKYLVCSFKDGEVHGHYQEWHKNGQPALDTHFDKGKEVGTVTKWYANGQMRSRATIIDEKFEGLNEFWWENGKRGYVRTYRAGKLHGKTESWDEFGRKEGEADWIAGKPVVSKGKVTKSTFKQVMALLAKQVNPTATTYVFAGPYVLLDALGEPDSKFKLRNNEEVWTYRCSDGSIALTVLNLADFIVKKVEEQ
jgi:antitoxin component YwqK of YwqJK toxin-antitoxin module